jgi:hypothetical protein
MFLIFLVEGRGGEEGHMGIKREAAIDVVHGAGFGKTFSSFIFAIVIVYRYGMDVTR